VPVSTTGVIVAGIDGSAAARGAARWAALDAERRGATLRLVHAVVAPQAGGYPEPVLLSPRVNEQMRTRAGKILRATADQLTADHPGLHIQTAQQNGHPVKVLLDQSRSSIATVVGADGAGRLSAAFFGSVAARLAAHGHGCIVIARPEPGEDATPGSGAVVVAVDGSPQARAAIGFAYEEAGLRGAALVAVHTWNDKPLHHALGVYPPRSNADRIDEQEHRLLDIELAGWARKYPQVPVRTRVLRGRPAPNLLRHAAITGEHPALLIVVGSRGRGGFTGLLLGSTSQAVLTHAECSVAILHT
jgi:nucleotide-binding universal stress UspA family protein